MKHHIVEQNGPEWDQLRLGRITASPAHVLYMDTKTKGYKQYRFKLAYERVFQEQCPEKFNGSWETEQGHERQQDAIDQYQIETFKKVHEPGFFSLDEWTGCSPDGLIGTDGLIEVKALIVGNTFREKIENGFKPETAQYEQCMFQLLVTGRQYVDLVFYPPTSKARMHVTRINRDEEYLDDMRNRIEAFKEDVKQEMETLKEYLR